ncbi:MAG: hypothetical protein J5890_05060, partial [Clostridia bacterium]|nr:hypothetical protein [Clostridia bacterium]
SSSLSFQAAAFYVDLVRTNIMPPLRKGRWIGGLKPSKTEGSFSLSRLSFQAVFNPSVILAMLG